MKKYFIYFLLLLFFSPGITGQQVQIDSLKNILKSKVNDTNKVMVLHKLCLITDSVDFSLRGLELSKKINYKKGNAISLLDIGRHYYFSGKQGLALDYLIKAIKAGEDIKNKKILIGAYRYTGFVYRGNDPYTAEDYYKKSLQLCRETGDELSASYALSAIGNIYEGAAEKKDRALKYYIESLNIRKRKGSYDEIASSLNETSRIYDIMGLYNKAVLLRLRGLDIAEKSGSTENIVSLAHVIGNDYAFRLHDLKRGLEYQLKAYELGKTLKNNFDIMYSINISIANVYYNLGDFKKSTEYFKESRHLNDSINFRAAKYNNNLSQIKHDLEEELEKQKLLLKDSEIEKILADAQRQTILRNAFLIGFTVVFILVIFVYKENKQKQKANNQLDLRNKEIETAYQTLAQSESNFKQITETINDVFYLYNIVKKKYEYISPNCSSLFGLAPDYFYEGKSMKTIVVKEDLQLVVDANIKVDSGTAYDIEYRVQVGDQIKWIAEKSSPIFDKYGSLIRNSGICRDITLRKANAELIARKNKDILDSILYARTIQDAVLVPKNEIAKQLKDFFIFSKPKDIVSGDFYFYKETKKGVILAAADCTGHGVPAGFLSMIGNAFLNEIVTLNEDITPAQILNELSKMIISSLNQNRSDSESKDGMDIAILYFDDKKETVQYAGAQNSVYIVRDCELKDIKADLFPVGISESDTVAPFKNTKIDLKKGDALYLFSDGFADQFGGAQGRKFMKRQLKDLLVENSTKPMTEQEKILDHTFTLWKGEFNQVDDVLIIGVKV
ncbi:MAG: SpoIIE family protein phosphatase [Bacteroidetes bacterium]|nr:SpoIIE family protein phosphatase [Bacteroidota bacterium]